MGLGAGGDVPRDDPAPIADGNELSVLIALNLANDAEVSSKGFLFLKLGSAETKQADGLVKASESQVPAVGRESNGVHWSPVPLEYGQQILGPDASSPPEPNGAVQAAGNQGLAVW